ncbi:PAS domain S-box protein, partial [Methylobacterium nigriterrae]|uniref:PAS domain S-box protein n=1 Tax=Methylobacterium nigriterrae TaxID=3127512 RepID=UPI003013DF3B
AVEYRVRMRDGTYRGFNARAAPILDEAGGIVAWAGVCIDIEGRKRAEAGLSARDSDFRVMADSIPQLAWMADATGALYWYNRRWVTYTGTDLDAMRGWGWQAVH